MKKLILTGLMVLTCGIAYALPVGNPADASLLCDGLIWEGNCCDPCDPCITWCDAFSFRLGFYGDYVYNRHMELDKNSQADIEDTEIYTNAALLVGNFYDRVDLFATLGATNLLIETNASAFIPGVSNRDGDRFVIETNTYFSWSVGARGTIWECGCTSLGLEGQYFYSNPEIKRLTLRENDTSYVDDTLRAKYQEWQVGVGLSHRIYMFVPYVAVKWSRALIDMDNAFITLIPGLGFTAATLTNLESKKCFGYAVGVTLVDCLQANITAEARFGDEKALYVNGQIRF